MSTHTHLKNFFPLISPLSKLLYILPLALSLMGLYSSSAIASEDETTHLLGEESPRINSSRSQHNPLESVLVHPIPEVIFDEQLLAIPDKDRAQKQYTVIKDFIALSSEDLFEQFKEKYKHIGAFQTKEELLEHLRKESADAISQPPTLASYLRDRRVQTENLISALRKFIDNEQSLRERLEQIQQAVESKDRIINDLKRSRSCGIVWVAVGGVVCIVSGIFLSHFFWK